MSLKKLDIGGSFRGSFQQHMLQNNFEWLVITFEHLVVLVSLPLHHKDPFDRIMIPQAIREQIPVVGCDVAFDAYPVRWLW